MSCFGEKLAEQHTVTDTLSDKLTC